METVLFWTIQCWYFVVRRYKIDGFEQFQTWFRTRHSLDLGSTVRVSQKKNVPPESKFIFQQNNFFSGNAFADLISPNTRNAKFLGVRTLLYSSAETSQAKLSNWTGLDSAKPIRTYHSTERELILKLCGWDKKKMGKKNLNEISRNAAIAVFNLDMKAAIEILKSGCTGSKGVRFLFCSLLLIL